MTCLLYRKKILYYTHVLFLQLVAVAPLLLLYLEFNQEGKIKANDYLLKSVIPVFQTTSYPVSEIISAIILGERSSPLFKLNNDCDQRRNHQVSLCDPAPTISCNA
jgi:hypothetical protein